MYLHNHLCILTRPGDLQRPVHLDPDEAVIDFWITKLYLLKDIAQMLH